MKRATQASPCAGATPERFEPRLCLTEILQMLTASLTADVTPAASGLDLVLDRIERMP